MTFETADIKMYSCSVHFRRHTMKASIVDLRYKMKEVLAALKRNETVHILYHGK